MTDDQPTTDEGPRLEENYKQVIKELTEELYESLDVAHTAIMTAEQDRSERGYAALGGEIAKKTDFLDNLEEKYEDFNDITDEIEDEREKDMEDENPFGETEADADIFG